jgi:hypothetical protein
MGENTSSTARRRVRAAPGALLLVIASCAQPAATASVAVPAIPAGEARIWFYRDYEPYAGKGFPAVAANGGFVGQAELGGAFYRDVPPGPYHITVQTFGIDVNQAANFTLAPMQEAYVKIVSNPEWVSYGVETEIERPTFYAWLIPSEAARADVAHLAFYGGS